MYLSNGQTQVIGNTLLPNSTRHVTGVGSAEPTPYGMHTTGTQETDWVASLGPFSTHTPAPQTTSSKHLSKTHSATPCPDQLTVRPDTSASMVITTLPTQDLPNALQVLAHDHLGIGDSDAWCSGSCAVSKKVMQTYCIGATTSLSIAWHVCCCSQHIYPFVHKARRP
jgi:hypothetical protein